MLAGKPYCSECERLQNENSLLRQQIALLNGSDSLLVSNRWQTLLIVGWLLLTILPIHTLNSKISPPPLGTHYPIFCRVFWQLIYTRWQRF